MSPNPPGVVEELLRAEYGLSGTLTRLAGENENYLVVTPKREKYVLKVVPEEIGEDLPELENAATEAVAASDDVRLALPRFVPTLAGRIEARHATTPHRTVRARLLTFVKGTPWCEAGPPSPARLGAVGRTVAHVANALTWVDHPAAQRTHRWDLTKVGSQRAKAALVEDTARRRIVDDAFMLWCAEAEPYLGALPQSLIHGDLNDENVILSGERVSGILDFGDSLFNPTVCDLAIALAYL